MSAPEYKACIQCGTTYELTTANFHKSKDGFHARCKRCRNTSEKKKRTKKTDRKLEEIERGAVELFTASARIGGANIPHTSELLEVLYTYFGGVSGFANAFMKQYFNAPAGGAFRTKMLDTMIRLTSNNTAMGGAKKPLTLWTEEELEDEMRQRLLAVATVITAIPDKSHENNAPTADSGGRGSDAPPAPDVLPPVRDGNDTPIG